MSSKFYLTTALHYVNGDPHVGHAYETILGDVLCRYFRLFGYEVHFLTGIDEHGQKIAQAAEKAGRTPQEHCDYMAERWQAVWKQLLIEPDVFFRTTHPDHKSFVAGILDKLHAKGDIYSSDYSGWYCTPDERFWTEKDVVEGKCPLCGRAVEHLTEKNYFFRMSSYQQWLIDWIAAHPDFIKPESRRNEVLGFLRQPLGDLCISRPKSRLSWGIPLPFDPDYVTYVWFDALLNYLSATRIHGGEGFTPDLWPANLHLIGKDIITTHAVYWPTMLQAAGFEPPQTILAHGWWMIGEAKMGKSVGNAVQPMALAEKYGADAFRYVLMAEMTPGLDANFSEEAFVKRYNSDLANDLGNLYSRLAKLRRSAGSVETPSRNAIEARAAVDPLTEKTRSLEGEVRDAVISFKPNVAIEAIGQVVRLLNQRIDAAKPWEDPLAHRAAIGEWLAALKVIANLLLPVLPGKMEALLGAIESGSELKLFPRIDVKKTEPAPREATPAESFVAIEDFAKLDLRVGKIVAAHRVEGSDKLLALNVDLGGEIRQVVAGIAASYSPNELIGGSVVVVANLKPAKLKGEVSQGMILAASDGGKHFIVAPQGEAAPGSKVK